MAKKKGPVALTRMELDVMRVLWAAGRPLTVREALPGVNRGRDKPLAYTTVQTVLMLLKDKGAVEVAPGPARAHTFAARLAREDVATTMVGDLVERVFGGQVRPLLHHLVESESLGPGELQDLKRLIEERLDDTPGGTR